MNKITNNSLVPQLRFPEFENDGEWGEKSLGQLSKKVTAKNKENLVNRVFTNSATDGIVNQRDYFDKDIANQNNLVGYFIVEQGDYIYNPRCSKFAPVGPINKNYIGQGVMSPLYTVFRFKEKGNEFYNHYFKFDTWHKYLLAIANSGARHDRMSISSADFMKMPLPYPSPSEQQKIADCLSSIDELITEESQKLDAYKDHKKGLMQNLFPADGAKVPQFRFPEFENDGDWVENNLKNVCVHFKGFAFQSKDYTSNGRRVVRVSDMGFDYIKDETNAIYIKENEAKLYEKWELQENDLLITTVGSKPPVYNSLVGRAIVVQSKHEKSLLNQNAVCLRANENIEQHYLNTLFKGEMYISFIESIIRGNANQGSIALEDLFKYEFLLPNPKEQRKIASCLSSIDELITTQDGKIESLKLHKRGLMQQLFPKA